MSSYTLELEIPMLFASGPIAASYVSDYHKGLILSRMENLISGGSISSDMLLPDLSSSEEPMFQELWKMCLVDMQISEETRLLEALKHLRTFLMTIFQFETKVVPPFSEEEYFCNIELPMSMALTTGRGGKSFRPLAYWRLQNAMSSFLVAPDKKISELNFVAFETDLFMAKNPKIETVGQLVEIIISHPKTLRL